MKVQTHAGKAVAEKGEVVLDGPSGVAVSMTPDAANGTAGELHKAARDAQEQAEHETSELPPEKRSNPPEA
jgi:hypothetical protein